MSGGTWTPEVEPPDPNVYDSPTSKHVMRKTPIEEGMAFARRVFSRARAMEKRIVGTMSLVAAPLYAYYAWTDFLEGSRWVPLLQAVMIVPSLLLPVALWKEWRAERLLRYLMVSGLALIFYVAIWDELPGDISSLVWLPAVPPVAYLGLRRGWSFSLLFGFLYYLTVAGVYLARGVAVEHYTESLFTYVITTIALELFSRVTGLYEGAWVALAHADALTELPNRLAFWGDVGSLIRQGVHPFSLVMFDLDDFKRINDTFGHDRGDALLVACARAVRSLLPPDARIYRWGGEEFMVLVPLDLPGALALAEQIRSALASLRVEGLPPVTGSFGVATYVPGEELRRLLARADRALYQAKADGKNCVRVGRVLG